MDCRGGVAVVWLFGTLTFASPPAAPVITEPNVDGKVVSAADVHMQASDYSDPDGQAHFCTDWEIDTLADTTTVWRADCLTGILKVHCHLGDGLFVGVTGLSPDTDYMLRARFHDDAGEIGPYADRLFHTGPASEVFPLQLEDVVDPPAPQWNGTGATLRLESADGQLLLSIGATTSNAPPLAGHVSTRVAVQAGGAGATLGETELQFEDEDGAVRTIFLPALTIGANETVLFWVSANGSTYVADALETEPNFQTVARTTTVPWEVLETGYKVEVFATDFQLPVNIAFLPNPGTATNSVFFYVTELYGNIKVVHRDGTVHDYATGLLNYDPTGNFPGSGEQGLAGIVVEPVTGDLFATVMYDAGGPHYPKVIRLHSNDGGRTAATVTNVLDMVGEDQGPSHQISNITLGPDGKLYVHVGDGFDFSQPLNLDSFRGKILRLNLDGTTPADNPFYNASDGITARDYIFAYGFRNPFGGAWRAADGTHYEVENGPSVDRLAKIVSGGNYRYDGTDASLMLSAIYNWTAGGAPVNCVFIQPSTFAGSGFPSGKFDHLYVTLSGPTYATGPQANGKHISEFVLNSAGNLLTGPDEFIRYNGSGVATACGLAAGPDGLYFTDLYKDNGASAVERGANVLRIRHVGVANFTATPRCGTAPVTVNFSDLSSLAQPATWEWSFGDGGTSSQRDPQHVFTSNSIYNVRLSVTGTDGLFAITKQAFVVIGETAGLQGEYFSGANLDTLVLTRVDSQVDFDWGSGAPADDLPVDDFSVRWTGEVVPEFSETYTFYTQTDDGVRLWVNNQLLIDDFTSRPLTENSGTISLTAGQAVPIKLEYFDGSAQAVARLLWSSASVAKTVVPASQLLALPCAAFAGTAWETKISGDETGAGYLVFEDDGTWTGYGVVAAGVVNVAGTWNDSAGVVTGTITGDLGDGTLTGTLKAGKKLRLALAIGARVIRLSGVVSADYPGLARFAWLPGSWTGTPTDFTVSESEPGLFTLTLSDQTTVPALASGKNKLVAPGAKGKLNQSKRSLQIGKPLAIRGSKP